MIGNQDTTGNAATVSDGVYTTSNQTITGIKTFSNPIILEDQPTEDNHATTKSYVDLVAPGLNIKDSVQIAFLENVESGVLDGSALSTIGGTDNIQFQVGWRLLVLHQQNPEENGIYVYAGGRIERADDFDEPKKVTGALIFVEQGSYANSWFVQTNPDISAIGTDHINFRKISVTDTTGPASSIANTTSNGFVKTINGNGTISIINQLVSNDIPNNAADTSGNATTATQLKTVRTIGGVDFDGTANIELASKNLSDTNNISLLDKNETFTGAKTFSQQIILEEQPTQDNHAATKQYVDALVQGLDIKDSVRLVITASLNEHPFTWENITLEHGDRVLLLGQNGAYGNGIYVWSKESFEYAADFDITTDLKGAFTFIEEGTFAGRGYVVTSTNGSNGIDFTWISEASRPNTGNGLDYNPAENVISLKTASNSTLGGIKVGDGLNINETDGTLSIQVATDVVDGLMSKEDKDKLDGIADNANNYDLPIASASLLGGIKVGTNLEIDTDGVLSAIAGSVRRDNEIITNNYTEHYLWNFYEDDLLKNPTDNSTSTDNELIFTNKNINIPTEFSYIGKLNTGTDLKYLYSDTNESVGTYKFNLENSNIKYFFDQLTNTGDKFIININFAYSNQNRTDTGGPTSKMVSSADGKLLNILISQHTHYLKLYNRIASSAKWTLQFLDTNWFRDSRKIKYIIIKTTDDLKIEWDDDSAGISVPNEQYIITNVPTGSLPMGLDIPHNHRLLPETYTPTEDASDTLVITQSSRSKEIIPNTTQQKIFEDAIITSATSDISLSNFIENSIEWILYKKVNNIWTYKIKWNVINTQTGITGTLTDYFSLDVNHEFWSDNPSGLSEAPGLYEDQSINYTSKLIRKYEFILEKIPEKSEYLPTNNSGIDSMNLRNYSVKNKNIANNSVSSNKLDFHRVQGYWEMSALDIDPSLNNYKILSNLNENYPNLYLTIIGEKVSQNNNEYLYLNNKQYTDGSTYETISDLKQISIPNLPNTNDYLLEEGDYIEHTYEIASSIAYVGDNTSQPNLPTTSIGIGPFKISDRIYNSSVFSLSLLTNDIINSPNSQEFLPTSDIIYDSDNSEHFPGYEEMVVEFGPNSSNIWLDESIPLLGQNFTISFEFKPNWQGNFDTHHSENILRLAKTPIVGEYSIWNNYPDGVWQEAYYPNEDLLNVFFKTSSIISIFLKGNNWIHALEIDFNLPEFLSNEKFYQFFITFDGEYLNIYMNDIKLFPLIANSNKKTNLQENILETDVFIILGTYYPLLNDNPDQLNGYMNNLFISPTLITELQISNLHNGSLYYSDITSTDSTYFWEFNGTDLYNVLINNNSQYKSKNHKYFPREIGDKIFKKTDTIGRTIHIGFDSITTFATSNSMSLDIITILSGINSETIHEVDVPEGENIFLGSDKVTLPINSTPSRIIKTVPKFARQITPTSTSDQTFETKFPLSPDFGNFVSISAISATEELTVSDKNNLKFTIRLTKGIEPYYYNISLNVSSYTSSTNIEYKDINIAALGGGDFFYDNHSGFFGDSGATIKHLLLKNIKVDYFCKSKQKNHIYPMLHLKNNLTENPVDNYMIKNNSITSDKLSQYKEHTWSWDFRTTHGTHQANSVHISATPSSYTLDDVTMSFTDNVIPNDTKGNTEYHTGNNTTNSSNDGFIKIKKLGTSYINISGLPDPNDYLTCPGSFFEIELTFKVSYNHSLLNSEHLLRNIINSAINLSYEITDGVIIKSIHIDNDTGEKIVMSNSNYPTPIEQIPATTTNWVQILKDADIYTSYTESFVTYRRQLLPLVLRMRISRHENNRYTLTNEINRYPNDELINSETVDTFILEYTNPNNNPLFYESVMKLFTFDVNFGSGILPSETYLGRLSFRYYTAPLDLHIKTTSNITTTEKILASGLQILNSTEDGLQRGIRVYKGDKQGVPIKIGTHGMLDDDTIETNTNVIFTSNSSSTTQNIKFKNYDTAGVSLLLQNSLGNWGIHTPGSSLQFLHDTVVRYRIDDNGHHFLGSLTNPEESRIHAGKMTVLSYDTADNQYGINVSEGNGINVSHGFPVIIGNYGVDNNFHQDKNSCVMFTAASDSEPKNIKFRNYGTADTRMIFQNVSGDRTDEFEGNFWAIQTNGSGAFKIQKGRQRSQWAATDIGTTFYKIDTTGNHDFMSGNITTTGTVSCKSIACEEDISTSGLVSCKKIASEGIITTDGNITSQGTVAGASLTAPGIIEGGNITCRGTLKVGGTAESINAIIDSDGNITSQGTVAGASLTTPGIIEGEDITCRQTLKVGPTDETIKASIDSDGKLTAEIITCNGDLTTDGNINIDGTITFSHRWQVQTYENEFRIYDAGNDVSRMIITPTGNTSFGGDISAGGNIYTSGSITAAGALTVIGNITTVGNVLTSQIVSPSTLNFTIGNAKVYEINSTGEHNFVGSLTTNGQVSCGSLTTNGTIGCGSLTTNGTIGCGSINTDGTIDCGSLTTPEIDCEILNCSNFIMVGNIDNGIRLSSDGNVTFTGSLIGPGSFNLSDERIKSNIQTLDPNTAKTMFDKIEVKTYDRTFHENESDVVKSRIGFLAQDITKMFESHEDLSISNTKENFVNTQKSFTMRGTEFRDFQSVDYSRMVTILWGTVKQMDSRIKELENKLNTFETLEARIQALETQ
jgi:hypothetical protein